MSIKIYFTKFIKYLEVNISLSLFSLNLRHTLQLVEISIKIYFTKFIKYLEVNISLSISLNLRHTLQLVEMSIKIYFTKFINYLEVNIIEYYTKGIKFNLMKSHVVSYRSRLTSRSRLVEMYNSNFDKFMKTTFVFYCKQECRWSPKTCALLRLVKFDS